VACWARPWQCETNVGRGRASSMWIVDTAIKVLRTHISAIDLLSLAHLGPSSSTTQRAVAVRPIVSLLTDPSFNRPPAPENPPYTLPLGHQPKKYKKEQEHRTTNAAGAALGTALRQWPTNRPQSTVAGIVVISRHHRRPSSYKTWAPLSMLP